MAQVAINFADDEELMSLAARAGCMGVFIGFESPTPDGLRALGKKFSLLGERDLRASVRRIQGHKILVAGSFVIGLDIDGPGIGRRIAETASRYGVNMLNVLFLTPLPGTRLWDQMNAENRIILNEYPTDWAHYTLGFPVARYKHLSVDESIEEVDACNRAFYSVPRIAGRVTRDLASRRRPLRTLVSNLASRGNARLGCDAHADFVRDQGERWNGNASQA
jgi:radical SAM superfamily enzyme YgiQ (UPF0313 family)